MKSDQRFIHIIAIAHFALKQNAIHGQWRENHTVSVRDENEPYKSTIKKTYSNNRKIQQHSLRAKKYVDRSETHDHTHTLLLIAKKRNETKRKEIDK